MNTNELNIIFGTGPLGRAVMRQLVAQGKRVRMVNRSGSAPDLPAAVEVVKGDATNPDSTRAVCKGAAVVYQCAQPGYTEWVEKFPPIQAGVLEGAAANGAKLIVGENLYMYGETDHPLTEDLPYNTHTRKGSVRARLSNDLMQAHRSGKVRVAIGRASDFYGAYVLGSAVGERVFYPALAGKAAQVTGNVDMPHTYTYIDDFAKGLVTLGERDEALGQAWHIPSAETLTTRQFLALVYKEAGQPLKFSAVGKLMLRLVGLFIPAAGEIVEMLYEFDRPFIVDHTKYERCFGSDPTPHRDAVRRTLDWYRANPKAR